MSHEQLSRTEIPSAARDFNGDPYAVNSKVIDIQKATGEEIDADWWSDHIDESQSPIDMVKQFDYEYALEIEARTLRKLAEQGVAAYAKEGLGQFETYLVNAAELDAGAEALTPEEQELLDGIEANYDLPYRAETVLSVGTVALERTTEINKYDYVDPDFPTMMRFMIGDQEYMVTGVWFEGDDGNFVTTELEIQPMSGDGEKEALTKKELYERIEAAKQSGYELVA